MTPASPVRVAGRLVLAATLGVLCVARAGAQGEPQPAPSAVPAGIDPSPAGDPRLAIETLAQNLDDAVRQVCRPSPANLFGPVQMTRGYRIPGVGVVFIVPPRTFAPVRVVRLRDGRLPPEPAAKAVPRSVRTIQRVPRRQETQEERELRAFQEQIKTWNDAALRMHQEAEQQFERMVREAMPNGAPVPSVSRAPVPAQPPWAEWWSSEEPSDTRSPREILDDVRQTLARALLTSAPLGLRDGESCVVSVEFVPSDAFDLNVRPATTLVARVSAQDLEALRKGGQPLEALVKRIDFHEFE